MWGLHQIYSSDEVREWVVEGCQSAGIGCIECKQPVIDAVLQEQAPIRERAMEFIENPKLVRTIIDHGCEKAREVARDTLTEVRQAMGLSS